MKHDTRVWRSGAVPGIDALYLEEGLIIAAETMARFSGGSIKGLQVFPLHSPVHDS
jgi:hypothetical protein